MSKMISNRNKVIGSLVFSIFLSTVTFSCNPHRRGATASQIGASSGQKFHKKPASAKRKKTIKY